MNPKQAREALDAHVRDTMQWHFGPETGSPFWLEFAKKLDFDPRRDVRSFDDLRRFPPFEDDWLRGGPVERWVPKGMAGEPIFVFETGGTTGVPKSRVASRDFRTDYELFSDQLPEQFFPKGSNWLMLGPSGPRRLRLSVEHLAQYRGGICFCIDLDPALGDQADPEGLDRAPQGLPGPLHRPGDHDPGRRPRHQVHVRHAEADRGAVPAARGAGHHAAQAGCRSGSSPAAPSSRRSGRGSRSKSCSTAPTSRPPTATR